MFAVPDESGIIGADRLLRDGDEVAVGSLRLRAIHSPGHTPEHLSYLLLDPDGAELALFSGGALMVGTMARPDLLGPSWTYALSRMGRETLHQRLLDASRRALRPAHPRRWVVLRLGVLRRARHHHRRRAA